MGLLFIPQMIYVYGEPWWNDTDRGKLKNSELQTDEKDETMVLVI
jgi:hypothetical protein